MIRSEQSRSFIKNTSWPDQIQEAIAGGRPAVVAELSGNHGKNLELARQMIYAAAKAGVTGVKLQTYTADTMTLPCRHEEFMIMESDSLWVGQSLHELYQKASTPWSWHRELFLLAQELGLLAFSSPFDCTAVDFLESLNVPCYKVASFEITDLPLLKHIGSTGKPVILSTGMSTIEEIQEAMETLGDSGSADIMLLKCTSAYPADPADCHLATLVDMKVRFGCPVGLSDHTRGMGSAIAGMTLGACLVEKHFTLSRDAGGVDAEFSTEPEELKSMVTELTDAHKALGRVCYGGSNAEQANKKYRRSLYLKVPVQKGEIITASHVQVIRPAMGLAPKYLSKVIGRTSVADLPRGTALQWHHFDS